MATIKDHGIGVQKYVDVLPKVIPIEDLTSSLHRELNVLFADRYFSSLWTLQEVVLRRNDALALSKEAEPVEWELDKYLCLTMFVNHCQMFSKTQNALKIKLKRP